MKTQVHMFDYKLRNAYDRLKTEDSVLYKWINKAIDELKINPFCGIHIQKRLIPKEYKVDNLWKYDLPSGWRLLYTVKKDEIYIISIILVWMKHKEYERKFKY